MYKLKVSDNLCVLPWIHVSTRSDGKVRPCCVGTPFSEYKKSRTLKELQNSPSLDELRKSFLKGEKPPYCKVCYSEEETNNLRSKRLRENEIWSEEYNNIINPKHESSSPLKLRYIEIRNHSICNLKCVMCHPRNSIALKNDFKIIENSISSRSKFLNEFGIAEGELQQNKENDLSNHWAEFDQIKNEIRLIYFRGGEPLLSPNHDYIINQCIETGLSKNISLKYNTNGTLINPTLIEKWNLFKSIKIQLSVDGTKEFSEYIRYPLKWSKIETALECLDKITTDFNFEMDLTLQYLNYFDLPNFLLMKSKLPFNYIKKNLATQLSQFHLLHSPNFLSIKNLDQKLIDDVAIKLNAVIDSIPLSDDEKKALKYRFESLRTYALNREIDFDVESNIIFLKNYLECLDQIRKTDHKKVFPFILN